MIYLPKSGFQCLLLLRPWLHYIVLPRSHLTCIHHVHWSLGSWSELLHFLASSFAFGHTSAFVVAWTWWYLFRIHWQKTIVPLCTTIEVILSFVMRFFHWRFIVHICQYTLRLTFYLLSFESFNWWTKILKFKWFSFNIFFEWWSIILILPWSWVRRFVIFNFPNFGYPFNLTSIHQWIKKSSNGVWLEHWWLLVLFIYWRFFWTFNCIFTWTYIVQLFKFEPFNLVFSPNCTLWIDFILHLLLVRTWTRLTFLLLCFLFL